MMFRTFSNVNLGKYLMLIIGIDPGISGSICLEDGIIKDVIEMPTMIEGKK